MKTISGLFLVAILLLGTSGNATEAKKDIEKFAGTWSLKELTYNGQDHTKLGFNVVFKGEEAVIEGNDEVKREYARIKFKLDSTTMPKLFDITVAAGVQKDTVMEGIYEFKGEELRICAKVFGKDRPTEFAAPGGSSTVLMVLKRAAQ